MEQSADTDQLFAAMVEAQGRIRDAGKDRANTQLKNRYATLEAVLEEVRPVFNAVGLAVCQSPGRVVDGMVHLTTQVIHRSGQFIRSESSCPLVGYKGSGPDENRGINAAQSFGVVVAYLRRYALMAVAGIVGTDDDTDGDMSGRRPDDRRQDRDEPARQERRQEPPRDDRREEPRQEPRQEQQRPQERREVDASRTGGQTVDFRAILERFRAIDPGWTNEAIAEALGVRDVFHAAPERLIELGKLAAAGTAKPGKPTTNQGSKAARREAP